ncbi:unnamed protein product [Symbiodinium sp. CCMP2456]|nr:unnamed protein product [Symbiodinium sp. CCMP2456]
MLTRSARAKREDLEQAGPMHAAKRRRISKKSLAFELRLAQWGEKCIAFQSSGKKWGPRQACCPASLFLWQEPANQQARPCVELLSQEELSELQDFYRKNPNHAFFNTDSTAGCVPERGEKPAEPPSRAGPRAEEGQIVTKFFRSLERQSGIQKIYWQRATASWRVRWEVSGKQKNLTFPISKHMKLGLVEAEAVEAALDEAKAFREELVRQGKLRPLTAKASGSRLRGVVYNKRRGRYHVQLRDPSTSKKVYGGVFKVKEEAEAKARELARELGLQEVVVPVKPLSELLHFEPLGPQKGIKWNRCEQGWHAQCGVRNQQAHDVSPQGFLGEGGGEVLEAGRGLAQAEGEGEGALQSRNLGKLFVSFVSAELDFAETRMSHLRTVLLQTGILLRGLPPLLQLPICCVCCLIKPYKP